MKKFRQVFQESLFIEIALITSLLLTGGFSEFFSCVIAVITSALLIIRIIRMKRFVLRLNLPVIAVLFILLWYLISVFYATDGGMAFLGFLKFMPVVLFLLLLLQDEKSAENTLLILPDIAVILGVLSLILMLIPSSPFMVEGRLSGFFQYPNTFAMFLLIGELLCLSKKELRVSDIIKALILIGLILVTMSRAVFVLMLVSNIVILFFKKSKLVKIVTAGAVILAIALVITLYPVLKDHALLGRFLSLSIFESTFAGRLLYWSDALPLLLKHPFGLGYLGYYYSEQSIQTGVYSVRYIHNDILQLMLDIGWLPTLAFLSCTAGGFISKNLTLERKVILAAFFLHILFDFDLEFTAMWFILLCFFDVQSGKKIIFRQKAGAVAAAIASGLLCLYFSFALGFDYFQNSDAAVEMYPLNTDARIKQLIKEEDIEKQEKIADDILKSNQYVQIAYSLKAQKAYSEGDFEKLISYKHQIFDLAPFSYSEYEEYAYMLINGIYLYSQMGDTESAAVCQRELIATEKRLSALSDRLSYFGRIIDDQPKTDLPEDITEYIRSLKG